jgi:redox-sensing transcriptional repressor
MRSSGSSSDSHAVPDIVVARLPLYLRALGSLLEAGREMVSSAELAEMLGVSSAQIRKDLSQFGEFGRQGAGYSVPALMARIRAILHIDREWPVVVIGAGSIGRAITNYSGFSDRGFRVCGIFDDDPLKIGALVGQLEVQAMDELPELLHRHAVRVAVLAVPGAVGHRSAGGVRRAGDSELRSGYAARFGCRSCAEHRSGVSSAAHDVLPRLIACATLSRHDPGSHR